MTSVGVVVATYGDKDHWFPLAQRALASVRAQTVQPDVVAYEHGTTLHEARNDGFVRTPVARCDRVIFLDADDELDPLYIEKMLEVEGDIIQPSTLGIVGDREDPFPVLIPEKNLIEGNYIVIGAMVNAALFAVVGGFHSWSYAEDWDLWIRMVLAGAKIGRAPEAIYRVHVNPNGRNLQARSEIVRVYHEIRNTHLAAWGQR